MFKSCSDKKINGSTCLQPSCDLAVAIIPTANFYVIGQPKKDIYVFCDFLLLFLSLLVQVSSLDMLPFFRCILLAYNRGH